MDIFPDFAKALNDVGQGDKTFSVCTLVSNPQEYEVMVTSALKAGFNLSSCEYLYIDNRENEFDAYSGLNKFLSLSKGKYVIICHQDVEFIYDNAEALKLKIEDINKKDPTWGVIGNVGGLNLHGQFINITEKNKHIKMGDFPQRINSLDENLLIIRKYSNLAFSNNLSGFHFYGTDICLISSVLGLGCWAIDFHLLHKSSGNLDVNFDLDKIKFTKKYEKALGTRFIRTSCTRIFVSSSKTLNKIMNSEFGLFVTKIIYKIKKEKAY